MPHPTPAETIKGIRQILKDVVEPHVADAYARYRLREIRALLATIDWNDPAAAVRRETDSLRNVLAEAARWVDADPIRTPVTRGVATEASADPEAGPSYEALLTYRDSLADSVIALSRQLREWAHDHPDDSARALRARLIDLMCS